MLLKLITIFLCASFAKSETNVVSWTLGFIRPYNKSVEFALDFYAPTTPGRYPVVVFLSGLDGLAIGPFYTEFNSYLANQSQSILVVFSGVKMVHLPDKEEKIFEKTLNWTLANLDGLMNNEKTPSVIKNLVFPDTKTWGISLMGHSSGNHPIVTYMNSTCGIVKCSFFSFIRDLIFKYFEFIPPPQKKKSAQIELGFENFI